MTEIFAEIPTPYRGSGRKGTMITFANIPLEDQAKYLEMGFAPGVPRTNDFAPKYLYPVDLWE